MFCVFICLCAGVLDVHCWHADQPGLPAAGAHSQHAAHVRHAGAVLGGVQHPRTQRLPRPEGQRTKTHLFRWRLQAVKVILAISDNTGQTRLSYFYIVKLCCGA